MIVPFTALVGINKDSTGFDLKSLSSDEAIFSWKLLQISSVTLGGGFLLQPCGDNLSRISNRPNLSLRRSLGETHSKAHLWNTSGPFPSVKHLEFSVFLHRNFNGHCKYNDLPVPRF